MTVSPMNIKCEMELLPEDKQPKHSARYGFKSGNAGVDSIYIKRSALPAELPQRITVEIHEDN